MANTFIYQDFSLDFKVHPVRKDLVMKTDANAVVQAIMNLLQLNHYESPFHPEVGSNLRRLLFENVTDFTARDISRFIQETITNFEPRATIQSLVVTPNEDQNQYNVMLRVFISTFTDPFKVDFILQKVR